MLTIHVWPRRLKEFLLTHPLYKSPSPVGSWVHRDFYVREHGISASSRSHIYGSICADNYVLRYRATTNTRHVAGRRFASYARCPDATACRPSASAMRRSTAQAYRLPATHRDTKARLSGTRKLTKSVVAISCSQRKEFFVLVIYCVFLKTGSRFGVEV